MPTDPAARSSSALALGLLTPGGPAAARARGASNARAAPPRAPDPVGWLGASRRQPRLLAQDDVEREAEAFQGAAQAGGVGGPPQRHQQLPLGGIAGWGPGVHRAPG